MKAVSGLSDLSSPFFCSFVSPDSLIFRSFVLAFTIICILPGCADTHISPFIIQAVTIDVVNEHTRRRIHNQSVHRYISSFDLTVSIQVFLTCGCVPFELIQPIVIGGVNDSELAFSKRDKACIWVGGLTDFRALGDKSG